LRDVFCIGDYRAKDRPKAEHIWFDFIKERPGVISGLPSSIWEGAAKAKQDRLKMVEAHE
jgi:hypothetical protein